MPHPKTRAYFFGFSRWKRSQTKKFFPEYTKEQIDFCGSLDEALKKGMTSKSHLYIWGKKPFEEVEHWAQESGALLSRIEDGFVRSVSLGSDLTKAYSLVVDSRGIYFDPTQESDLEHILNTYTFDEPLLARARALQSYLVEKKISKYNIHQDKTLTLPNHTPSQKVLLVPGQVEDDASIRYGAKGMSNLELLKKSRESAPDGYIIYKPHPDVLAGNRKGHIEPKEALKYCDTIITDASLDSVLACCDEVHTMTSLVGLEALIRKKRVYTYGLPFYAGWGLTTDASICHRRTAKCSLDALVAATYILYPRYIDPLTNLPCELETTLTNIEVTKKRYNNDTIFRWRLQGRNFISRKVQLLIKVILGE